MAVILYRLKIGNKAETEILINRTGLEEGLNLFSTIVEIDVKDPISGTQMKKH